MSKSKTQGDFVEIGPESENLLKVPIVSKRAILKFGRSYGICIPKEWFEVHGIDPETQDGLILVADLDIRIVNPKHEEEVYSDVSGIVKRGRYSDRRREEK